MLIENIGLAGGIIYRRYSLAVDGNPLSYIRWEGHEGMMCPTSMNQSPAAVLIFVFTY